MDKNLTREEIEKNYMKELEDKYKYNYQIYKDFNKNDKQKQEDQEYGRKFITERLKKRFITKDTREDCDNILKTINKITQKENISIRKYLKDTPINDIPMAIKKITQKSFDYMNKVTFCDNVPGLFDMSFDKKQGIYISGKIDGEYGLAYAKLFNGHLNCMGLEGKTKYKMGIFNDLIMKLLIELKKNILQEKLIKNTKEIDLESGKELFEGSCLGKDIQSNITKLKNNSKFKDYFEFSEINGHLHARLKNNYELGFKENKSEIWYTDHDNKYYKKRQKIHETILDEYTNFKLQKNP